MHCNDYKEFGDFNHDGREFIINRMDTPRPWINYAWSDNLLVKIDQRGEGDNLYKNDAGDRSVAISDRFVYLRDSENGEFWTIGWGKIKQEKARYSCRHGLGYSVIGCDYRGLSCEWTISSTEQSVEVWEISLKNNSDKEKEFSLFAGVLFELGGWVPYGSLENYSAADINGNNMIFAQNRAKERPEARNHAFFAVSDTPDSFECSRSEFLGGCYEEFCSPESVKNGELGNNPAMNEDLAGIFQFNLKLSPGQKIKIQAANAPCFDLEEAKTGATAASPDGIKSALDTAKKRTEIFSRQDFELPEEDWTRFFNIWGKQQLLLLKDYARLFLIGFRDTLQDAAAITGYNPQLAADSIFKALAFQNSDGSALRGWSPIDTHPYGDSGVWLPMALAEYIRESGDYEFLQRRQKYYDRGDATVWEHTCKALDWFEKNLGEHGLPKLYFGDWNDSLNIGRKGRGESVWLAMALVVALSDAEEIARHTNRPDEAAEFKQQADEMRQNIERHAWDGEWYIRGFSDEGNPVGSKTNKFGKIFSEPQSWAAMAGLAPERVAASALSVEKYLATPYGLVVCNPAFQDYSSEYGRISTMLPGWGENGSCYCHVTAFQAVADCMRRDGDSAIKRLESILPFNPALSVNTSKLEPYAFSNMFRGPENLRSGETFKGWTSGTVPWAMRCMTHYIFGIRPDFDGLIIDPVLPQNWPQIKMKRTFHDYILNIEIHNSKRIKSTQTKTKVSLNGIKINDNRLAVNMLNKGENDLQVELEYMPEQQEVADGCLTC